VSCSGKEYGRGESLTYSQQFWWKFVKKMGAGNGKATVEDLVHIGIAEHDISVLWESGVVAP